MTYRGILFDAGGVLTGPAGGRWNPRYDFEEIVLRHHPGIRSALFPAAFEEGQRVLDAGPATVPRADYHRAVLRVLGVPSPSSSLLRALEAPAGRPVLEAYPDVRPVLDRLRDTGIRMCVVSDAWAELPDLFRELDLDGYFEGFVISEVLGCNKPDPRMYFAGSELLGLQPAECLFVDDDPELVAAAVRLGFQALTLVREPGAEVAAPGVITALDQLLS